MNNPANSERENNLNASLPDDLDERERALSHIVDQNETEENLVKLAAKLSTEWKEPVTKSPKPDLSFAKFEEKLRKKGD